MVDIAVPFSIADRDGTHHQKSGQSRDGASVQAPIRSHQSDGECQAGTRAASGQIYPKAQSQGDNWVTPALGNPPSHYPWGAGERRYIELGLVEEGE